MAHDGERSRRLLQRLDLIAERRERRRRAEEQERAAHEARHPEACKQDGYRT